MKQSVYLETTIPSYMAARVSKDPMIAGRQAATRRFFESERHKYELFVSAYVYDECSKGDADAAKRRLGLLKGIAVLEETADVRPLAEKYVRILSLPEKARTDAFHLAICCIKGIDILLSWNCSHLGVENMLIAKNYNDLHGLLTPQMITPDSLVGKYVEVNFNE